MTPVSVPMHDVGGRLAYLPALDGARAIAVGLVMVYHLDLGILRGGFLGVDLFFVLSGFLITTLLIREYTERRRIDLVSFWLRRARRLLPALFLVIAAIAVWAAGSSPFERDQLRWDVLSVLGYVTNWRFIAAEQSYFQEFATPSPVQHLWSLAIEEQFYVVWPVVVLGGLILAARSRWAGWLVTGALVLAIGVSATTLALGWDEFDASAAYFATHTRAHELLIGALAAVLLERSPAFATVIQRVARMLGLSALGVLLAFAVLMTDSSPVYYFGGSLAFSLAAIALVVSLAVAGGRDRPWAASRLLSVPPLPWIGAISYGLYLWHWPVIVWLTPEMTGLDGLPLAAARLLVTGLVAAASFAVIERPIRRGSLGRVRLGGRVVASGAMIGALLLSLLTVVNTRGGRPIPEFVSHNLDLIVSRVADPGGAVGLVGDSVAMSLYPGLAYRTAATSRDFAAAVFPGCPVGEALRVDGDGRPLPFARQCRRVVAARQNELVSRFDPSIIFWLSARDRFDIKDGDAILEAGSPGWEAAAFRDWDQVLDRLTAKGGHVILILPFHRPGDDPDECAGAEALPSEDCTQPILAINALRAEYIRWAQMYPDDVTVIQPDSVLCPANPCPGTVGGVAMHSDRVHFTEEGSLLAAERLLTLVPTSIWSGR